MSQTKLKVIKIVWQKNWLFDNFCYTIFTIGRRTIVHKTIDINGLNKKEKLGFSGVGWRTKLKSYCLLQLMAINVAEVESCFDLED